MSGAEPAGGDDDDAHDAEQTAVASAKRSATASANPSPSKKSNGVQATARAPQQGSRLLIYRQLFSYLETGIRQPQTRAVRVVPTTSMPNPLGLPTTSVPVAQILPPSNVPVLPTRSVAVPRVLPTNSLLGPLGLPTTSMLAPRYWPQFLPTTSVPVSRVLPTTSTTSGSVPSKSACADMSEEEAKTAAKSAKNSAACKEYRVRKKAERAADKLELEQWRARDQLRD